MSRFKTYLVGCVIAILPIASAALAGPGQEAVLEQYATQAKAANPNFTGFSAEGGKTIYFSTHTVNPEAPSCSTCHTDNPKQPGKGRAGKSLDAMAVSVTPDRFTDMEKTEKWFGRNCPSVMGRECTAQEKGDFITFLSQQ